MGPMGSSPANGGVESGSVPCITVGAMLPCRQDKWCLQEDGRPDTWALAAREPPPESWGGMHACSGRDAPHKPAAHCRCPRAGMAEASGPVKLASPCRMGPVVKAAVEWQLGRAGGEPAEGESLPGGRKIKGDSLRSVRAPSARILALPGEGPCRPQPSKTRSEGTDLSSSRGLSGSR